MSTARPEEIRELVRQRYAEIARDGSVNAAARCCGPQPAQIAARIGYSAEDTSAVPEGANLGLGCGAPLAAAAFASSFVDPVSPTIDSGRPSAAPLWSSSCSMRARSRSIDADRSSGAPARSGAKRGRLMSCNSFADADR